MEKLTGTAAHGDDDHAQLNDLEGATTIAVRKMFFISLVFDTITIYVLPF